MAEKRRTRSIAGQTKVQRPTTQTTLRDLFRKTNSDTAPTVKGQDPHPERERTDVITPSPEVADPRPPPQPSRPPKPSQLFPIFTMVSSVRQRPPVINVDDTEVIDITDMPSDTDLSTEPSLSATHQPTPVSESSQPTSHSPAPSPAKLNVHCSSDTSFPHAGTNGHTRPCKKSNKGSNKRIPALGDVAPFPSSCSQHVRGVQHPYTCSLTPSMRNVSASCSPSDEGALNFLTKLRQPDDAPWTLLDRIHESLTPQQCEEYLQSLRRDCIELHPAFAQISLDREKSSPHSVEMWTRRFRPRRANEVLGNERHSLYLRDWLRALELHLRSGQPEEPVMKTGENTGKPASKKTDPRGVKRPRVIRAVTRKRGNKKRRVDSDDDLDDFVVFSDVDEEQVDDCPEDSEDELAFCQRTLTRLHRHDTTGTHDTRLITSNSPDSEIEHPLSRLHEPIRTDLGDNLTNTLLITGPPGCGKTAAVYACAEELGWEVFEVYPGIGRRNGASLDHLVGNVGRNHIVQTVHRRARGKTTQGEAAEHMGLGGYLGKRKTGGFAGFGESREAGTEGQPISVEGDNPTHEVQPLPQDEKEASDEADMSGKRHAESDGSREIVRQSVVLLEEVDILFKEDAGFWPAVVDFIRGCQRPVVMTCNDPGLVPVGDLPLQTVLVFEPCPAAVAATFLQCVSLTEGCLFPHEDLMVLYESRDAKYGLEVPDAREYPRTEPVEFGDLRRSITQLQILCAGARHGSVSEMQQGDEAEGHVRRSARPISAATRVMPAGTRVERELWRQMKRQSELMSHVDAELCRRGCMDGIEVVRDEEETGHVVLEGEVFWEADELIAEEAIRHSRGVHEGGGTGPNEASINPAARRVGGRVGYRSRMEAALEAIVGRPGAVMGRAGVFLDYIPWVRHMVGVDDVLERRALAESRGGRCTRNSLGRVHARSVAVREDERDMWRSGLI